MSRTRGFTLIEMLISLVVLSFVMSGAIWFFRGVNRAVSGTSDRMDAMQNLRYGLCRRWTASCGSRAPAPPSSSRPSSTSARRWWPSTPTW